MNKQRSRLRMLPVLLALLALALIWASGMGRNVFEFEHLEMTGLDFGQAKNKTFRISRGAEHGVLNSGPNFSLPAGEYTLEWTIETDAPNAIRIQTSNGARVEPTEFEVAPNTWTQRGTFALLDDAENLELLICFDAGEKLLIHDFKLSFVCTDNLWIFTLLVLALCALYVAHCRGALTVQRKRVLILLALAVLVASVPALRENLNAGHDSEFHRLRLRNVVSALSEGQFPVRVGGSMYNGYGSRTSIFYPDLCLYLPALMMLGGATIQLAMSVLIIAIHALSAWTAYACGRRIFADGADDSAAGVCVSVLYTLASYRLTDVYARMALGEAAAMAVMPLFILGLYEVFFGDRDRWPVLVLGASAVFLSHILSTVLCGVLAACVLVLCCVRVVRERRLCALIRAAVMTMLVCLFFLVPLVQGMIGGTNMGALHSSVSAAALEPVALFAPDADAPMDIGPALLVAAALSLFVLAGKTDKRAKAARVFLLLGGCAAFASTDLFPWAMLERHLGDMLNILQFPWRLLMFADIFLALGCGYGLCCLAAEYKWKELAAPCALVLCVLAAYPQITTYATVENAPLRYWSSNTQMITAYAEYTLADTDLAATRDCRVLTDGGVEATAYEKRGTRVTAQVSAKEGGSVSFPLFGFEGYSAALDGKEIAWRLGENNRLTVDLPAGSQGEISIRFAGRTIWRIADGISLVSALALAVCLFVRRKREIAESKQN